MAGCRHLRNANVDHCRQRQRTLSALRRLELSVSRAIGVSLIHAESKLRLQPEYTEFLHRLATASEHPGSC